MRDLRGNEILTDMSYIKLFPYVFFGCIVLGATGNMLWFSSAQKISAQTGKQFDQSVRLVRLSHGQTEQTGYVMEGIQEAVGELIVALKASSNRLLDFMKGDRYYLVQSSLI